ncbi:hypothetical protein EV363DRAFT_1167165, partial [Boletus edulis]
RMFSRRGKNICDRCIPSVVSTPNGSATSGKRVSDDITLNSHPDVAAFQLIRQVTPASI